MTYTEVLCRERYQLTFSVWADIKKRHETPEDIRVKDMIRKKYDDLGKPSYEEWVVGFHFVTLGLF